MARVQLEADSRPIQRAERDLRQLNATGARTESVTNRMTGAYRALGGVLTTLGAARFWGMVLSNTIEQERVTAQLEATLRSTGRYTPELSRSMQDYARSLQQVTAFGDEAIIASQGVLLTFGQIGEEAFPRAQAAVLDVATAMGMDLTSAARQVGRAIDDPIRGLQALSRMGINFNDTQRQTIQSLIDMGDVASAQSIILSELETRFGGSARAARNTLGGAIQSLKNSFGDLLEGDTDGQGVNGAVEAINKLTETLNDPEVQAGFQAMVQGLFGIAEGAAAAVPKLIEFNRWANESTNVVARAGRAYADYMQWLYGTALASKDATEAQEELNEAKEEVIPTLEGVTRLTAESNRENQALTEITNQLSAEIERLTYSLWGEAEAYETVVAARNAGVDLYSEEGQRLADQIDKRNQLIAAIERQESALSQFNQLQAEMENQELRNMDALERTELMFNQRLDIIQLAYEQEQITQEQAHRAQLLALQQFEDERTRIEEEGMRARQARQQVQLAAASQLFGSLSEIADRFGDEQRGVNRALFVAQKAFSIAQSIMAIQTGIAQAAALPFPSNLGAMATVASATAGIVSTIQGVPEPRRNGGYAAGGRNILVGEAGPEVIRMPQGGGRVTPYNDLMRQSQGGDVQVPIYLSVSVDSSAEQDSVNERREGDKRIIDVVVANVRGRKQIHRAIMDSTNSKNRAE